MSQPPSIPPRPSKSQEKGSNDAKAPPKIPPRPSRHLERKISEDRFAPSPLSGGFPKNPKIDRFSPGEDVDKFSSEHHEHHPDRPGSVSMPSLGEEGAEYAAAVEELQEPERPEQTRTVGGDMKLHAPKPSLPVQSAKQRVAAVTHIDSAKAASFGLGTESPSAPGTHKKSSTSLLSSEDGRDVDEVNASPEIGQRVPMYRDAGDVQAPSPAPQSLSPKAEKGKKHHQRSLSGQTADCPPGSYGLRGHGHISSDKLEKAYYDKHPDELQKELTRRYHDRQNDFAMSKNELNQVIRETASHGSGLGTSNYQGTPSEDIGYKAHDEYASRVASPSSGRATAKSHLSGESLAASKQQGGKETQDEDTIHVDDRRDDSTTEERDHAPILADDEVANYPPRFELHAAVEPSPEVPVEHEGPASRPTSRHSSRSASAHVGQVPEFDITPLEDVKEYEPLFSEEGQEAEPLPSPSIDRASAPLRFPSKDIWEDAPSSAHYTAEVTTDAGETEPSRAVPDRSIPTPAQAFAKHQEELAEREAQRTKNFVPRGDAKGSSWLPLQPVVVAAEGTQPRPPSQRRFPSRDVWEDAPESHHYQTTVSSAQVPESPIEPPDVPLRPTRSKEKPAVPERPKPKTTPSDEARPKPVVSDKPKPQVPARPVKSGSVSSESRDAPVPKAKPVIPTKPVGGKIAALQAGFMSDLNKRLQLGPLPPKKEEQRSPVGEDEVEAPKKPLSDARKGRARGPQRRAPARSPAPPVAAAADTTKPEAPSLSFSVTHVIWSIDPEDSNLSVKDADSEEAPKDAPKPDAAPDASPKSESPGVDAPTPSSSDEPQDSSKSNPLNAESPNEVSQEEEAVEAATSEVVSTDDVTAKPVVPAVEPLEDVLEVDRLGDLPPPELDSPAPVVSDGAKEGDAEKVEV
ncbi:uncharacterized protein DNG_07722 [Cephalotrichum gorgonifer]|uniref:Altered inheritance of mitochondria protein 21 n=1 Tax=Cephalotrichum gorgonifer TaxID=2041049 RepID=A0AAE8N568_9PEZI|nr:uncharacterized protein DNG_07722 [Cephalotrichum gorgonifer]